MVLGVLNQLQIFLQLHLIELLVLVTGLWLLEAFDGVWHAGFLHKPKSCGITAQICGLISYFLSNRWVRVALDVNSSLEY